jgi:DNA-binding CsgD family transcriptional regulator
MGFKKRQKPKSAVPAEWAGLTARHQEVALLLMSGNHTMPAIAEELGIGTKTVDTHRLNLLFELGIKNNVQLAHYGLRHRLVPNEYK